MVPSTKIKIIFCFCHLVLVKNFLKITKNLEFGTQYENIVKNEFLNYFELVENISKSKKNATDDDDDDKENDVPKMSALEFLGNKEGLERIELERKHLREINAKINHMVECRLSSIQITQDQIDAEVRRYWLECQEDNIPKRPRIQIRKKDRDFAYNRLFKKKN